MYWGQRTIDCDARLKQELDDARYEADELRRERDRLVEAQYAADQERRRQRIAQYEYQEREASTWPEALRKQAGLLGREVYLEDDSDPTEDHFFSRSAAACRRALELWSVEEAKVSPQIADLQRQIDVIRDGIRLAVADALDAEGAEKSIANALREHNEDACEEFLQW
jgi:hypothetical protein